MSRHAWFLPDSRKGVAEKGRVHFPQTVSLQDPASTHASRCNPFNPLDSTAECAVRLFQIVVCLKPQPEAFTGPQCKRQTHRGIRGYTALAEHDFVDTLDFVFLVLPLNDESKNFMNAQRLALMKDGAVLINIARGAIVDTDALVAELNSGRIFAGLDVTNPEPLPEGHPLWSAKNCIITPHVGGNSTAFESRGKAFS